MHVIVVGCGRVGSLLAMRLAGEGHTVAVIDKSEFAFRRLRPNWGGTQIVGFGFDRDSLIEAGAERADALAAVTSGDNSNILTARIARENFMIPAVTARIYDPRRAAIYQRLGISTVATVRWTIDQVLRALEPDRIATEWTDPTGHVRLVTRGLPSSWCGRNLRDLEEQSGGRIVALTRNGTTSLATSGMIGQEGDIISLAVETDKDAVVEAALGLTAEELR
jgi:trk system potassium uptake protein TrkA